MDSNLVAGIRLKLNTRDTEELTTLWIHNDRDQYSEEFFEAVRLSLQDRLTSPLPPQHHRAPAPRPPSLSRYDKIHLAGTVLSGVFAFVILALLMSPPATVQSIGGMPPIMGLLVIASGGLAFYFLFPRLRKQPQSPATMTGKKIALAMPSSAGGCSCSQSAGCGNSQMRIHREASQPGSELLPVLILMKNPTGNGDDHLYCLNPAPEPFFIRAESNHNPHFLEIMLGAGEYVQVGDMGGGERDTNLAFILEVERLADGEIWRLSHQLHDPSTETITLPGVGEGAVVKPWIGRKVDDG